MHYHKHTDKDDKLMPLKITPKNRVALQDILNYGIKTQPPAIKQIAEALQYKLKDMQVLTIGKTNLVILACLATDFLHKLDRGFLINYQPTTRYQKSNPIDKNLPNHYQCRLIHDYLLCQCDSDPKMRADLKHILETKSS